MTEYNIENYDSFSEAKNTIKQIKNSQESLSQKMEEGKTTLKNATVFQGPIQESCIEGFNESINKIQSQETNFQTLQGYLQNTNDNYQNADTTTSNLMTNHNFGISSDTSGYTNTNSYTNSKNGIKYKLYDQGIGDWANYQYDDGKTVEYKGCMLTAASVISSSYDSSITPKDLFNEHRHDFVSSSVPAETGGNFSASSLNINENTGNEIINNLQQGNPSIIMVKGNTNFTSSQHYMALLDISNDGSQIFIGNSHSNDGGNYSSNGWYPTQEVLSGIQEATVFTPSDSVKNKFKNDSIPT